MKTHAKQDSLPLLVLRDNTEAPQIMKFNSAAYVKGTYNTGTLADAFSMVFSPLCKCVTCRCEDVEEEPLGFGGGTNETSSALTHFVAAFVFLAYGCVQIHVLRDGDQFSVATSIAATFTVAFTFVVSSTYHVASLIKHYNHIFRTLDHAAIVLLTIVMTVADSAVTSSGSESSLSYGRRVDYQTIADPIIAGTLVILFFAVRRTLLTRAETEGTLFDTLEGCSLGFFQVVHTDLEHTFTRVSTSNTLGAVWVLYSVPAYYSMTTSAFVVWLTAWSVSSLFLILGVVLMHYYVLEHALLASSEASRAVWRRYCTSPLYIGCSMGSHAWWHILSAAAVAAIVMARDWVILNEGSDV